MLILTCMLTASGIYYAYSKLSSIGRVQLGNALAPPDTTSGAAQPGILGPEAVLGGDDVQQIGFEPGARARARLGGVDDPGDGHGQQRHGDRQAGGASRARHVRRQRAS